VAVDDTDDGGDFAARQLAPVKNRFQDAAGIRGQLSEPDFLISPEQDARAQAVWLHQPFHEGDLVDAGGEEKSREFNESLFTEIASSVEVIAARQIARGQVTLVNLDMAGKATRHRPDCAGIKGFQHRRVRHEPGYAAVAVKKRVNPGKPVMCGGGGDDDIRLAQVPVEFAETLHETGHGARADGQMLAEGDIAVAQLSGSDTDAFLCFRVFDQQQLFGQQFAKAAMDFADAFSRDRAAFEAALINPFLNGDMAVASRWRSRLAASLL
jgi:hypothetical protein